MSTNDPNDRFALPPLAGLFGEEPDPAPAAEEPIDDILPPETPYFAVAVDAEDPVHEDPLPSDPAPDEPAETEPEEAPVDEVEPSEVEPSEEESELAPAGMLGIAQALEVVEQLSAAESVAPVTTDEPTDSSAADADALVFATAASDLSSERPTFGIPEMEVPAEAAALFSAPADDDDELLPHFLRADAAAATLEDNAGWAPPTEAVAMREADKGKPGVARTLAEIPVLLIVAAVIAFLVKSFLAQAYYIPSGSMLPQLQIDDRVVVSKLAYKTHDPRRGDIIVFDDPRTGNQTTEATERTGASKWVRKIGEGVGVIQPSTDEFIKRVIGLPGDTVEAHDGDVYINGQKLVEPYLPEGVTTSDFSPQKIDPGRLWVMGDNRSGSADSRVFGQIRSSTIVGRAVVKVWPFSHISFL